MAGVFEAGDIVKYGEMMIKRPPTHAKVRIKAWQSKFFVLRDKTQDSRQRLEYYKDASAFEFHKSAEHCIYLDSIVYIGETQSSKSHCHPLMVVCSKQGPFALGCDNEEATADWIHALNKVAVKVGGNGSSEMWQYASIDDSPVNTPEVSRRISHENSSGVPQNLEEQGSIRKLSRTRTINSSANAGFFVTTRLTPFSEQNNIRGDYMLCISEGQVILKSVDKTVTIVTWPVGHLRSYLSEPAKTAGDKDMQLLTLNAGRRSATGEGIFQFLTKHGDTIIDEIRRQSQHVFQSAAQKREAFVRGQSLNGSDPRISPPSHPSRISRTNSAPPEKVTRILAKKDRIHLAENPKRLRSETDPTAGQKSENDSAAVTVNGSPNGSASILGLRPRSATDSSVEKPGDDEVFLTQPTPYCEIDDGVQEATDTSEVSAYIDLLSDSTAEPIHISDPVHSRKMSNESLTSTSSMTSEDGSMRNRSLPRNLSSPRLIPEADETDAEGYIRCEALQTGAGEKEHDGNVNVVDVLASQNAPENQMSNLSSTERRSSPNALTTVETGGLGLSPGNSSIYGEISEDMVAQIKDPNVETFPPKPKLERERVLVFEDAFLLTQSKTDNEGLNTSLVTAGKVDAVHALLEQARDPESSKKLLDEIIAQMETPLQHDVSELFPVATRKRNSIGAVPLEAVRADQVKSKGGSPFKKHSVIEKSKSTCEGFLPRASSPGPPPVPLRPETLDKRKACLSVGDISEDLHKRPDLINMHRPSSTFFAKGLKSVNPRRLMSPIRANFSASQLGGGEAATHARFIQNTEIRDELAQFSALPAQTVATREDTSTCPIGDGGSTATCAVVDEVIFNTTDSGDKFCKSTENVDEDVQYNMWRRKDSKASKFVKKVKKLAAKPRQGSNDSRENDDDYSGPSERLQRESLSPGDVLDLQGRFTGSETNSPETSPTKNSKMSPKDKRKLSSKEKSKEDKETAASKILRIVTKGDQKKDEYNQRASFKKISREESPNKDVSNDNISKPLSPTKRNASGPKNPRRKSGYENANKSYEDYEYRPYQSVEQLERLVDCGNLPSGDFQEPAPAIPPKKKSYPPPIPPRIPRSPPSPKSAASPVHSPPPQHATRQPQPAVPFPREGRRHSSSSTGRHRSSSGQKDDFLPPPPVPPRNTQSPENKKVQSANKASAARRPVIQRTCSSPENRDDSSKRQNSGLLPVIAKGKSPRQDSSVLRGTVTNKGGVLLNENVKLICPPGAVDDSLSVSVILEDPSKYYGQFVLKDLENNVKFGAPIISLGPSGHFFNKPLTLKSMVDINFNWDDVLILHGSKTSGGKITWQDISHNSNIDEANTGLVIEIEHFSIIAILYRLSRATLLCTKDIISRLNLLAFNYTLSVLLKKSSPSLVHDELALLFVSQDVYHEQFYREDDTSSALMQLKKEGFVELHVRCSQDEKSIYNNETLEVIVRLGEDYKLVDSQQESTSFTVHSYDWWHTGKVLRIPLEWSKDVRSLCGKVSVRGDYGHTSESLFSEPELCGYVRSLLGVEGAIFNVIPIAKLVEMPEESLNRLTKSQKDENEQLEIVLQHWLKRNNVVEGLAALRKNLESLKQEDYKVTERGQMHIRHLRKVASKILGLQHETTYSQNYFIRKIQSLCKSVFSDCCIELEVTADNVERAASSTNHAQYLIQSIENHCPALPQDIETKYQEVCSVFEKSTIKTFLIIVPYLIQNIKDIFAGERISEIPQNGLRGLPKETLDHFVSSVRNATGNNGFFELLCDACNLLEQLCLENYDKEPNTEIEKWGESMAMLSLLNYLQPFFQHCCKDIRLYKRLDLFVRYLRKTIADRDYIDELFVYDLSNVLMSLIHFAKIDPSKVVRFELNSSTDLPFSCPRETVRYDRLEKTYSQVFRIKRETEDELQLHATARVYIDGEICRKGAFQLTMMLTPSSEKALNGYITRFHDVTVTKLEDKDSGNLRVFFCTARKEKLLELLDVLRKELRENVVDLSRPEVTRCPLSMRSLVTLKADTVLNLRLVYKWGSEAVVLDSKDFVAYTRPSQCVGSSKEPILLDEQLSNAGRNQLEEERLVRGSNVHTSGDMQIFIRMMDEREITMDVNRSDYIRKVKRDIHRLYQYPSDSQRLVFAGMRLEDNCSLSDYNIQNRSTLHLVQRLRGIAGNLHRETDGHGAVRLV